MITPSLIYHYTSVESFYKIITSGKIWLSDARRMNDYKEIEICLKLLESLSDVYPQVSETLPAQIFFQNMPDVDYYICSFSEHSDLLSQWFRYGQDGAGMALGFSYSNEDLRENYTTPYLNFMTNLSIQARHVNYINKADQDNPEKLFQLIFDCIRNPQDYSLMSPATKSLFEDSMKMKDYGFHEEHEVRIGCFSARSLGYLTARCSPFTKTLCNLPILQRPTERDLVRYLPLPINNNTGLQLKKIIKGPACRVADADIYFLLEKSGYTNRVDISSSQTPYRP